MCSVGDAFRIGIEGDIKVQNDMHNKCKNEFKGTGMEMTCL